MKKFELAISLAAIWVPTSAAVIAGLYFTKDPKCLFGMFIPTLISISSKPVAK